MRGKRWGTGFALFGEVVITGVTVALLAVPVITALPALAAGTAHLRRYLAGERVGVADTLRDLRAAWRALWPAALGFTGVAVLLLWNLSLAEAGVIPGSDALLLAVPLLVAGWAVLLLRTAAGWRPGADIGAGAAVREAGELTWRDATGSVLLAVACAMCVVFVWMLPPLLLVTGGLLSLAAVAVDHRRGKPAAR